MADKEKIQTRIDELIQQQARVIEEITRRQQEIAALNTEAHQLEGRIKERRDDLAALEADDAGTNR